MDPENKNNPVGEPNMPQSMPAQAGNTPAPEPMSAPAQVSEPMPKPMPEPMTNPEPETMSAPEPEPMTNPEPETMSAPADPTPQMSSAMSGEPTVKDSKSTGPIIGSIVIVVIIIIGGLYFWGKQLTNDDTELTGPDADQISAQEDDLLTKLNNQGTSDELSDIESDLDTTDLNDLDNELDDIDLNF